MSDAKETDYSGEYKEESFWQKVKKYALGAGRGLIYNVLVLYFCMKDKDTPMKAKAVIVGALGYFIMPLDLIPDFTPGVGYADDMGAVALALAMVAAHVKPEHKQQAQEWVDKLFGKEEKAEEAEEV